MIVRLLDNEPECARWPLVVSSKLGTYSGAIAFDGSRIVSKSALRLVFLADVTQIRPEGAAEALHGMAMFALRRRALVEDSSAAISIPGKVQDICRRHGLSELLRPLRFRNELLVKHSHIRVSMPRGLSDRDLLQVVRPAVLSISRSKTSAPPLESIRRSAVSRRIGENLSSCKISRSVRRSWNSTIPRRAALATFG